MLRAIVSYYGKIIGEPLPIVETHMMLLGKSVSTFSFFDRSHNITLLDMTVFLLFSIKIIRRKMTIALAAHAVM